MREACGKLSTGIDERDQTTNAIKERKKAKIRKTQGRHRRIAHKGARSPSAATAIATTTRTQKEETANRRGRRKEVEGKMGKPVRREDTYTVSHQTPCRRTAGYTPVERNHTARF